MQIRMEVTIYCLTVMYQERIVCLFDEKHIMMRSHINVNVQAQKKYSEPWQPKTQCTDIGDGKVIG